jgi:phosphoglycolate phosphatase
MQLEEWAKRLTTNKLEVKALLLDLDGTLVDSRDALREAGRAGFAAIGFAGINDDKIAFEVARRLEQDLPLDDLFTKFDIDEEAEERFLPAYLNAYYSAVISESKLFPKVGQTLDILEQHFILALVTLRYVVREQVVDQLQHLGIKKHFRVVVTALDVEKPKPFPDAPLLAAKKLNIPISKCAIVGDSVVDIQAGKAAGAKTIGVLTGLFSLEELRKEKPDIIAADVNMLPDLLSGA